jgi:hypothetical protein
MCNCLKKVNGMLAREGEELLTVHLPEDPATLYPTLVVVPLSGNAYRKPFMPTFCPFCGKPYDPDHDAAQELIGISDPMPLTVAQEAPHANH